MPKISVRDNENNRWNRTAKTKKQKTKTKESKGDKSHSERVRASLTFKSKLELVLSIISKERELYKSKHVAVECRCLKIWDLLSFLICSSILVLKWRQVSLI